MRKLSLGEVMPADAFYVATIDGETFVYDEGDAEYVALRLPDFRMQKLLSITSRHNEARADLDDPANDYRLMRDSVTAGVGYKGKSFSETKQAFKRAVLSEQAIEDNMNIKVGRAMEATTLEELEAITW